MKEISKFQINGKDVVLNGVDISIPVNKQSEQPASCKSVNEKVNGVVEVVNQAVVDINEKIAEYSPIVIEGNVTNAPDEETLTSVNYGGGDVIALKNRPYLPTQGSGMGYVILRKTDDFKTVVEAQTDGNTIFVIKYDFTLTGNVTMPANCVLEFDGGWLKGYAVYPSQNCRIVNFPYRMSSQDDTNFTTTNNYSFKGSDYYNYPSLYDAQNYAHYVGQNIHVNGYFKEDDFGDADYTIISESIAQNENHFFVDYWLSGSIAKGSGLYTKVLNNNIYKGLWYKYKNTKGYIDLVSFGVKYDCNYINSNDGKWYTDSTCTTLSTDNVGIVNAALGQIVWWSVKKLPTTIRMSKNVLINSPLRLTPSTSTVKFYSDSYNIEKNCFTTNAEIDYLVGCFGTNITDLMTPNCTFENIRFHGNNLANYGIVIKCQSSHCKLVSCAGSYCKTANLVMFGISSTFHLDYFSTGYSKYGVLVTSYINIDGTDYTDPCNGVVNLNGVIGSWNTDALIGINVLAQGTTILCKGLHVENQPCVVDIVQNTNANKINKIIINIDGVYCDWGSFNSNAKGIVNIHSDISLMPKIDIKGTVTTNDSKNIINDEKNNVHITMEDYVGYNWSYQPEIVYGCINYEPPIQYYNENGKFFHDNKLHYNVAALTSRATKGLIVFDGANDNLPVWFDGTKWRKFDGTDR